MKIEKLTKEQENQLAVCREKWLAIGLSTQPANRKEAEEGVRLAYASANKQPPKLFIWLDSPLAGAIGAEMLKNCKNAGAKVEAQVWAQVGAQVRDQVYRCGYGNHDANWLAFYEFFREQCGLECCEKLIGLQKISQNAGWWWPFEGAVILTERHEVLKRDEQGRLHCTDGPALRYKDGFGIWSIHGVRVPQYVIEEPSKITVATIESEKNAEVRRVMIERYGQAKYLVDSCAKKIHSDDFGTLYRKDISGDESLMMVKVVNSTPEPDGSFKDYFIRVPPTMKRAREAVAWTFYKEEMVYAPCLET